jgi:putative ABC transport system permease protein
MPTVVNDIRFAVRSLLKHRTFATIVVATLALGIGANTAIFSVVNAALLRPLPFPEPDNLYLIWSHRPASGLPQLPLSLPNALDVRQHAHAFQSLAVWTSFNDSRFSVTGGCAAADCEPEKVQYAIVSSNLFDVLGARPELGRGFNAADDNRATAHGVLVSQRLWDRRFGSRRSVAGATIALDGSTVDVIGVLPSGFRFVNAPREPDVWLPLGLDPFRDRVYARGANALGVVGRLRPGVDAATAQRELTTIATDLEREFPSFNRGTTLRLVSLRDQATLGVRQGLLILLGAVGLVLLIGCANVANLLLARASSRHQEIAIRAALGASRGRLVGQMLCESVVLSLAGGAAGLLLASWLVEVPAAVPLAAPNVFVPYATQPDQVRIDGVVLAFTLGVSIGTGLLFGIVPALRASRPSLYSALATRGPGSGDPARVRTRQLLVVAEVALALTLLVGAGLLLRSFANLRAVDPGFRADHVLTVDLNLPRSRYAAASRQEQFFDALIERVAALPSVQSVGGIEELPLSGPQQTSDFRIIGAAPPPPGDEPDAAYASVTPGYFSAMSLQLTRGRVLGAADRALAPRVAVINEAMARRFWPNENPVGKRLALSIESLRFDRPNAPPTLDFEGSAREIVGVVADVRASAIADPAMPALYIPFAQRPVTDLTLTVRTTGDPTRLVAPIRSAIRALDPDQPVSGVAAMADIVAASVQQPRNRTTLIAVFAVVALLLAAIGVYGVMAYAVTERTREIGVRVALGASAGDVLHLIIRGALGMTSIGVAIGLLGGVAASRLLGSLLFGVQATDAATFIAAAVAIMAVAALASWLPARRASRVDPAVALRDS